MIVYEVNLQVDNGIFEPFVTWLKAHIREMGDFDGSVKGRLKLQKREIQVVPFWLSVIRFETGRP